MKQLFSAVLLVLVAAGCARNSGGQQPPTPILTCPTPTLGANNTPGNYGLITPLPGVSATSYTDAAATVGKTYCYIGQTVQGAGMAAASNVVMVAVPTGAKGVLISWSAVASDGVATPYTYAISRVEATSTFPPNMTLAPPIVAKLEVPQQTMARALPTDRIPMADVGLVVYYSGDPLAKYAGDSLAKNGALTVGIKDDFVLPAHIAKSKVTSRIPYLFAKGQALQIHATVQ